MFQDSPIYDRLVAECGDVPAQVRREAERVHRELELVMRPLHFPGHGLAPERPQGNPGNPGNGWQRGALLPGPR